MRRCSPIQAARTGSRLRDPFGESPGHITLPNMWCRAARTSCSSASITCTQPHRRRPPRPLYCARLLLVAWMPTATMSRRQVYCGKQRDSGMKQASMLVGRPAVALIALTEHRPPTHRGASLAGGRPGCA